MSNPDNIRRAIEGWYKRGVHVVPLILGVGEDGRKKPTFREPWDQCSSKEEALRRLELLGDGCNALAIKTGPVNDLFVLDIDRGKGKDGFKTLEKFGISIPKTALAVQTPSTGLQIYFRFPPALTGYSQRQDVFGDNSGLDIRGEGGIVFAPPTVFEGGAYVRFERESRKEWYQPPEALIHVLLSYPLAKEYVDRMDGAISGNGGHDKTWHVVMTLAEGFGLHPELVWRLMERYNQKCQPPWGYKDLRHKVDDAMKRVSPTDKGRLTDDYIGGTPIHDIIEAENAKLDPSWGILTSESALAEVWNLYHGKIDEPKTTGWDSVDSILRVKKRQFMVVTGVPGMGKSVFVNNLCVNLAATYGWRSVVFSPENTHGEYLKEIAEIWMQRPIASMSPDEIRDAMGWCDRHLRYLANEEFTPDQMLAKFDHLYEGWGVDVCVIDPWNYVNSDEQETLRSGGYTWTNNQLKKLVKFTRERDVLLIVVAHPKKLEALVTNKQEIKRKYPVPELYDISGTACWNDRADLGVVIHRDPYAKDGVTEVHTKKIKKRQLGEPGVAFLRFKKDCGRLESHYEFN